MLLAAAVVVGMLAGTATPAVAAPNDSAGPDTRGFGDVVIRRTAQGIPHIKAGSWEGLGYGYGYAFARDNLCAMADTYVTVTAKRSKYFGPDASYPNRGNGSTANNLNSDFFFQRIIDARTIEKLLAQPAPTGPRAPIRRAVRGYVAGYNRYIADTGVDNISDPACKGKAWVKPITEMDAYRRFYQLALLASGGVAIDGIAGAQPPSPPLNGGSVPAGAELDTMLGELGSQLPLGAIGSNAIALGKNGTAEGNGLLLGNPHFPWDGPERFWQAHLTIPGKIDVSGGSLFGVPVVLIGNTRNLAWSHTVSTAFRFTPFEVKLVPGSPTTYLVDGQPREMTAETVTVKARRADGTLEDRTRTLYSTKYGPILTSILGLPVFPWTPATAFSMGDANATNFRYLNHFFETNLAQSVREYDQVLKRNQGIPWVNSIAADSRGEAYYADISVVPHVTNRKAADCNTALGAATYQALRLPVLDGSRSQCNWGQDADAVQKGIFGPSNLPSLRRRDYVTNSNDSYWLANPEEPLTGFARIIGDERTPRALRTRLGLRIVQQRIDGSDGLPGRRFTLTQLQDAVFNNRQYAGELWRDELVAYCESHPVVTGTSGPVDVSEACPILAAWNLRDDLDSRGAILFRRFAGRALAAQSGPYDVPFNPDDAVNTPRGLNTDNPQVQAAFADSVKELRDQGIPLDARLGDYQYEKRGDEKIEIHGGPGTVGVFNAINVPFVAGQGYPNVPHGSSFVQVVRLTGGCPRARTILTYSQSTDPTSPHFADQTRMFSGKQWVRMAFCEADIRAEPNLETQVLRP